MLQLNARRCALLLLLGVLNGCAAAPPIRTPVPTALPAEAGTPTRPVATGTAVSATAGTGTRPSSTAPTRTAGPTAGAIAPADATVAARAASATALAAVRPPDAAPPLATFFFYWYDCPLQECDAARLLAIPDGWQSPLDFDPDARDGRYYSSMNYDWFEQEFRTIASTGITIVLPVSWGEHPHPWFRPDRIDTLVQANSVLEQPLQIGLFLDTTAQQASYQLWQGRDYRFGAAIEALPLSDPLSGYFFYDRHIRDYFERVPREMWATIDGRPLIVTYSAQCCRDLQLAGELWGAVKRAFAADFGVEPWLILEETWLSADGSVTGLPSAAGVADGVYRWGSALNGMQSVELRGFRVSSVGPGFDNSGVATGSDARQQSRHRAPDGSTGDAAFLRAGLAAIPADSDLILIETWNEWPENTAIAPAAYRGADGRLIAEDSYLELVRSWRRAR